MGIPHTRSSVREIVTVSIGIATTIPATHSSRHEFLHDVDMALYRAKENGRDRIVQVACELTLPIF